MMTMLKRSQTEETFNAAPDDAAREADRWSTRMARGPLSADEARAFNQWMSADEEHEKAFQSTQALRHEMAHLKQLDRYDAWMQPSLYERIASCVTEFQERLATQKPFQRGLALAGSAVAAAAACVVVVLNVFTTQPMQTAPAIVTEPPVKTEIAEVRDVTLPDGSVITIGAASSVQLAFNENERRVILSEGEAFFDVVKDKDRPFLVVAESTIVRVLGTKFDVSLATDGVDVAVSEGRVEVIRPDAPRAAIRERDVKHVLIAGQKVTTPHRGRVKPVQTINTADVAAWREGNLVWTDTPLKDIIADLNRYSEDGITLEAAGVADLDYTLAVQADDVSRAVRLIATSLDLEVIEASDGEIVLH